jgi:ElaB/YqjD/DUF883 family membrane-anchored ribosome-binding protein
MEQQTTMVEFNRAKGKLARDLKAVITDSEDLLKAASAVSGEGFAAARVKFEEKLTSARACLAEASRSAAERTKETAAVVDGYVQESPWTAVGVAAVAGMLIGFLAARR